MSINEARAENKRTLAGILGIPEEDAESKLGAAIQVTWDVSDESAAITGRFAVDLLSRTFDYVNANAGAPAIEVVLNSSPGQFEGAAQLRATISPHRLKIAIGGEPEDTPIRVPGPLCLLAACFIAASATAHVLGLTDKMKDRREVDFDRWPGDLSAALLDTTDIGEAVLVGAGAVGNAFLLALGQFPVSGKITVIDPKPVKRGALNRCLLFVPEDEGKPKAVALVERAAPGVPNIALQPWVGTLESYREQVGEFGCLVVGVDSRRARRHIQEEIPREVFDASTSGTEEVVFFHHTSERFDEACLGCVYAENEGERTHLNHVAEMLNVSTVEVAEGYISEAAAKKICEKYSLPIPEVVGLAYDSLFKALCATQALISPEDKQVLAPFSFVSQLAGVVLAIEMVKRRAREAESTFNYWRMSPWRTPNVDLQQSRPNNPSCDICGDVDYRALVSELWALPD